MTVSAKGILNKVSPKVKNSGDVLVLGITCNYDRAEKENLVAIFDNEVDVVLKLGAEVKTEFHGIVSKVVPASRKTKVIEVEVTAPLSGLRADKVIRLFGEEVELVFTGEVQDQELFDE